MSAAVVVAVPGDGEPPGGSRSTSEPRRPPRRVPSEDYEAPDPARLSSLRGQSRGQSRDWEIAAEPPEAEPAAGPDPEPEPEHNPGSTGRRAPAAGGEPAWLSAAPEQDGVVPELVETESLQQGLGTLYEPLSLELEVRPSPSSSSSAAAGCHETADASISPPAAPPIGQP